MSASPEKSNDIPTTLIALFCGLDPFVLPLVPVGDVSPLSKPIPESDADSELACGAIRNVRGELVPPLQLLGKQRGELL